VKSFVFVVGVTTLIGLDFGTKLSIPTKESTKAKKYTLELWRRVRLLPRSTSFGLISPITKAISKVILSSKNRLNIDENPNIADFCNQNHKVFLVLTGNPNVN
jgi:hypothetical protein